MWRVHSVRNAAAAICMGKNVCHYFVYDGPPAWNSLPHCLWDSSLRLLVFRYKFKSHLYVPIRRYSRKAATFVGIHATSRVNPLTPTAARWVTAIKHPVPNRVKPLDYMTLLYDVMWYSAIT